ncbi:hypothetical protein ACFWYW_56385 [Nonomuraea sp. NPDC059023]|uniref:hypothetical protein n=1 Tax=unclassified Nonomuraea TaxID=2593643 RepID=UPI003677E769
MNITGTIVGLDLTVPDAPEIRDFYAAVIGWQPQTLQGTLATDDDDFVIASPGGDWVAGVCHRRGENADLPPPRLAYIAVDNLENQPEDLHRTRRHPAHPDQGRARIEPLLRHSGPGRRDASAH